MHSGVGRAQSPVHFCFRLNPEHQPACDLTTPLLDPALESSQSSTWESPGHAFLQTKKQVFGIGVRLFVEPLLDLWPDRFKRVRASAPGSRSTGSLAMGRAHFAIAPHCRKAGYETAQVLAYWKSFGVSNTHFTVRLHSSETSFRSRRRSQGVAGGWYFLMTLAPSRVFESSLKEGWKKFT